MSSTVLRVARLRTYFHSADGLVRAVDDVSFDLQEGETLGIVGESGCGKSVTCLSIMRLIDPPGKIEPESSILLRGRELTELPESDMRHIRGDQIAMVFQEPTTSLNPVWSIGDQVAESVRIHRGASANEARERAIEMLGLVGIPSPKQRVDDYPHEFSGGMRQRVMIAMALACQPDVLIADEPTTALDVTIQAEILELLTDLQQRLGMSMIFVSHDLGVVAQIAHKVIVMYGGQIVESGPTGTIFQRPRHPYSEGLLRAIPRVTRKVPRLATIPGEVPNPKSWPPGCRFHPRCPYAWTRCQEHTPPLIGGGHTSRCWLEDEPERRAPERAAMERP